MIPESELVEDKLSGEFVNPELNQIYNVRKGWLRRLKKVKSSVLFIFLCGEHDSSLVMSLYLTFIFLISKQILLIIRIGICPITQDIYKSITYA